MTFVTSTRLHILPKDCIMSVKLIKQYDQDFLPIQFVICTVVNEVSNHQEIENWDRGEGSMGIPDLIGDNLGAFSGKYQFGCNYF